VIPAIEHSRVLLYTVAVALGMRQGELLALRWSDVDLEAGTINVRHTLRRGVRALGEPKTERAKRTLRMGDTVIATLRAHRTPTAGRASRGWPVVGGS
jgi:integrase